MKMLSELLMMEIDCSQANETSDGIWKTIFIFGWWFKTMLEGGSWGILWIRTGWTMERAGLVWLLSIHGVNGGKDNGMKIEWWWDREDCEEECEEWAIERNKSSNEVCRRIRRRRKFEKIARRIRKDEFQAFLWCPLAFFCMVTWWKWKWYHYAKLSCNHCAMYGIIEM